MFGNWELYDKEKQYYNKMGQPLTLDDIVKEYPIAQVEVFAVNTQGLIIMEYKTVNEMRFELLLKNTVEDDEVVNLYNQYSYDEQTESTPLERIASALEYIAMKMSQEGE